MMLALFIGICVGIVLAIVVFWYEVTSGELPGDWEGETENGADDENN